MFIIEPMSDISIPFYDGIKLLQAVARKPHYVAISR